MATATPEERYAFKLSPELLDKAVTQLNEPRDNAQRLAEIDKLKEGFAKKGKKYTLIRDDDSFLLRFLRAKKFNQDKALKMLISYHACRIDVFDEVENPVLIKDSFNIGFCLMLPHKDKEGRSVMIARDGMLKEDVDMNDLFAIFILGLEKELKDEEFQINGLSSIEDLKDLNMKIIFKMSTSVMRKMTYITQDAMPVRYQAMNMVNEGKAYDLIFKLIRPFLTKKMADRIFLHGTNFSKLHEQIDPQHLPDYLGGSAGDLVEASIKWGEELCSWKEKESCV